MSAWAARLLLTAAFLAIAAAEGFQASTVECDKAEYGNRFCVLNNAVVWRGKVYLISKARLEVPAVRLHTFFDYEYREKDLQLQDFTEVVNPASLPFASVTNVTHYATGGAFKRTLINNWFHTFTEDGANWAARFCRGLGLCSFHDFHGADGGNLMLFLDMAGLAQGNFGDFHSCWGHGVLLRFVPATHALVVRRLLVGVGSECNPPHCFRDGKGMSPLSADSVKSWIQLVRTCAGLPPNPPLRQSNPHVLFVNRAYSAGRSVVTLSEAYSAIKANASHYPNVSFELVHLEGMYWKDAAALFARSDVVMFPHGAQTSSATFLPLRSQVVHIAATEPHVRANVAIMRNLALYLDLGHSDITVNLAEGTVLAVEKLVRDFKGVDALSKEDLKILIHGHVCPRSLPDCPDFNLFSRYLNYVVPQELLISKVEEALARWREARSAMPERRLHRARAVRHRGGPAAARAASS